MSDSLEPDDNDDNDTSKNVGTPFSCADCEGIQIEL